MTPFASRPDGFVLHHSLTADGRRVSWPAIREYHRTVKGWDDIGYHFGVELAGTTFEALIGRPMDRVGAHCPQDGMNAHTWGICLVGNFDKNPPPREQLVVLFERVLIPLARLHDIKLSPSTVTFHRDHTQDGRTCPGRAFTKGLLQQYLLEFMG